MFMAMPTFMAPPLAFVVPTIFRRSAVAGKLGANPSGERLACPGRHVQPLQSRRSRIAAAFEQGIVREASMRSSARMDTAAVVPAADFAFDPALLSNRRRFSTGD